MGILNIAIVTVLLRIPTPKVEVVVRTVRSTAWKAYRTSNGWGGISPGEVIGDQISISSSESVHLSAPAHLPKNFNPLALFLLLPQALHFIPFDILCRRQQWSFRPGYP